MAYGLKYYKELTQPNGKVVRLEILEKGYEGASKEIGPVCQALRLDIQGDTEIDAPIVKTSLSMTFVDAPDHADAHKKKCGNWDEFYTSDATLWRVVLKARNAQETAFTTIWGGYVTPDSYTEVLQYRGSVTLVARDNIGHLSDFPFDAEGNADGMISLIELIREAWDKIESPMTLDDQAVANADWMLSDGVYAYDTYMNVSAFEDMNWYDALKSALYAYGLVLRYTGNNNVSFYSLRNLPRMGAHEVEDISFVEPTFMSGAERELTPAVKRIEEAVDYEIVEQKAAPMGESVTFTGASSTIPFESKNIFGEKEWKNIPTWPIDNTTNEGWGNDKSKTLFFSPKAYGNNSFGNELYIATNTDGSGSVWYGQHMQGKSFAFTLSFGQLIERIGSGGITPIYLLPITVKKVDVVISASANGVTSYLNAGGSWQTSEAVLSLDIDEEARTATKDIALGAFSLDESLVKITIKNITLGAKSGEEWWDTSAGLGIYVAINALTFTNSNGEPLCETNRVNTNYDAKNNIILSRDPKIAPALNDVLFPSIIKNGIFVKEGRTYNPAKTWYWGGQTPQQMAVYNHLQLLCYHAKPNNILRGTIVNADVADMQVIWMWHGAEHMLVSGTLDLISGYIENAVLREFARYEDMWGMLEPADMPEVEGKSSTNVEGGATASNEGARMTSTTTVNIGGGSGSIVLDTFMSDTSQNGVQNRVIKAYVDNSCSDLDTRLNEKADNTTVTALAERVSANEGAIDDNAGNIKKNSDAIDALDKRVTDEEAVTTTYASWWADLKKYIKVEGSNVKIDTNLIVSGDTSSGGSGQDTPASGTVTGIKVGPMSTDILTPNNAGIIDMVSVLSSIDVSDQLTAYAKTEDVNAALLTKQDTISDLATIRSGAALGATALQKITKTMVDSVLGSTTAGNANRFLMSTGSTSVWAAISDYALPLSGGTITATNGYGIIIDSKLSNGSYNKFFVNGVEKATIGYYNGIAYIANEATHYRIGVADDGTPIYRLGSATSATQYTLIHSGNIGSYALQTYGTDMPSNVVNYVGYGKIEGGWKEYGPAISFGIANYYTQIQRKYNSNQFYIRGYWEGNYSDWKTIAFTDSDITGNAATANKLITSSGAAYATWGSSYTEFGLTSWENYFNGSKVIFRNASGQTMLINSSGNVTIGGSDLAGTTYKMSVDGKVHIRSTAGASMNEGAGSLIVGNGTVLMIDANDIQAKTNGTTAGPLYINDWGGNVILCGQNNGNVLIGTTTDNGEKLQVEGNILSSGYVRGGSINIGADYKGDASVGYDCIERSVLGGTLYLQYYHSGNINLCQGGGNVGIGTTDPQYKLDVTGSISALYALRIGGCGTTYCGLYPNSQITSSGNATRLWLYSEQGLAIYGSTIEMISAVTMSSTLSVGNDVTLGAGLFMGNNVGFFFKNTSNANVLAMHVDTSNVLQIAYNNVNSVAIQRDTHINGNLIVSGDTSSGSDIRFKDIIKDKTLKIEHIAKAPLFTFKWNDREDDTIHLGSSAQYWEKVTPWLVKGEGFKTLDYSTLGVAMGISLAKKAVNHEERIKELERKVKSLEEENRRLRYGN